MCVGGGGGGGGVGGGGGGGGGEEEFNTFLIWRTRGFDWGEVIGLRDIVAINQTNICTRYSKQPTLC